MKHPLVEATPERRILKKWVICPQQSINSIRFARSNRYQPDHHGAIAALAKSLAMFNSKEPLPISVK